MLYFISTFPLFQLDRGHVLSLPRHTTRDSLILQYSNVVFFLIARKESPRQEGGSPCRQSIGFGFVFKSSPQWARPTKSSFPLGEIKVKSVWHLCPDPHAYPPAVVWSLPAETEGGGRDIAHHESTNRDMHMQQTTSHSITFFYMFFFFLLPPSRKGKRVKY